MPVQALSALVVCTVVPSILVTATLSVPITPHVLRHGFATHFAGDIRDLQAILGHKSLETTMGYLHAEALSVRSPLEALA